MKELRALTGARGVAAWWVVLFHLRLQVAAPPWAERVMAHGYLAVDFFFLLSGFVIWLAHADGIGAGGRRAVPAFWWRRVARIWPLHLVMLAFAAALALALLAAGRGDPVRFSWAQFPAHLLLLQSWGVADPLIWNNPAWSISAELAAYLLFPCLALAVDWRRWPSVAVAAGGVAALGGMAAAMHAGGLVSLRQAIPTFGALRCVAEFAAGTCVAALWLRWRDRPALPALVSAAVFAASLAAWWSDAAEPFALPLAFAALLLVLALYANHPRNPLAGRAAHWLGTISFATYLSHSLLWKAFELVAVRRTPVPAPLVALYLLLVLLASAILYARVERPAQRWLLARGPERSTPARIAPPWTTSSGATTAAPASPASSFAANGPISPPTAHASPTVTRSTG